MSVHCIIFLVMLFACSLVRTTLFVDSSVIVPNCFHSCPLLVRYSGELFLVSYVHFCCGLIYLVFLDCDVYYCGVAAVGHIVLCEVCICFVRGLTKRLL
jgi:hypothetical protein